MNENIELFETIAFNLCMAGLFILIGLAIKDVIKIGNIPTIGKWVIWLVLFLGCFGYISKGIIMLYLEYRI